MIFASLRYLAGEIGHSPSAREVTDSEHCPSAALIRMRFGTFNAAIRAAGLEPMAPGGKWIRRRRSVERSNHRWVLATIDPEKARAITDAKRRYWQGAA
jgi:hypothetical protein